MSTLRVVDNAESTMGHRPDSLKDVAMRGKVLCLHKVFASSMISSFSPHLSWMSKRGSMMRYYSLDLSVPDNE